MKSNIFLNITTNIDGLIVKCKRIAKAYQSGNLSEIQECAGLARDTQGKLDKVFQSEMYHLIGMGDLTIGQSTQFIKKLKELGAYRPIVKTVATMDVTRCLIPQIKKSSYQSILAGVVLCGTPDLPGNNITL